MTDVPFGRGGSPLQNLISRGIQDTKLTALRCGAEMDAGPVYMKRPLNLSGTAEEIYRRAATVMTGMIEEIALGQIVPQPQEGDAMAERIKTRGHAQALLPPSAAPAGGTAHAAWLGTSQEDDASATSKALSGSPCDWLVVDHYALDAEWEQALRSRARRILAIDDLADRPHACDTLLDQNLQPAGANRYEGLLPRHCRALIGPAYALLRPEFHTAPLREGPGETRRLNIFFGGIDAAGMTLRALKELAPLLAGGIAADVVAGQGNPQLAAIRDCCAELGAALHVQSGEMARLFAAADLGVGAGGATSWERCRMGLATVVVSVAENQRSGCQALRDQGAAVWLGDASALRPGAIREAVERLAADADTRLAMARQGQALVDGRGTERVMMHMMREKVALRPAAQSDAHRAWLWRNHPDTRRFFHDSSPVLYATHLDWWREAVSADDRVLLIAQCGGVDIGVVRLDCGAGRALVSIYLDPERTGLGLGAAVLRAGTEWIFANKEDITRLDAEILPQNSNSAQAFASAGYARQSDILWTRSVR